MSMAREVSQTRGLELSATSGATAVRHRGLWRDAIRRLAHNRLSLMGLVVVGMLFAVALFGPYIAPYSYVEQDLATVSDPPSAEHWLGTDQLGRDTLSRILWGARTATIVAAFVTGVSLTIGVALGGMAAYAGGKVDWLVMRLADIAMSVPSIMLAILVSATAKRPVASWFEALHRQSGWAMFDQTLYVDYLVVLGALSLVIWPDYARLIRGQILSLRAREYVVAARCSGASSRRILLRHLVPNALGPVIVAATFGFSGAMVMEASLSYLGIGIQPPAASWGAMINDSLLDWRYRPWLIAVPATVLGISALAVNFLGDGLNDALNPRLSRGRKSS